MRYLIIGLGIYGANLARDLAAQGHEVIGADINETNVNAVKDYISTAYITDTTDETALGVLPVSGVDVVIVAIGENFGASVKTVALLKQMGVKHLYARAIDDLHHAILSCFNLERILTPEQHAAEHLALEMMLGSDVTVLDVARDCFVARFRAPDFYAGTPYPRLNLSEMGITLIAATRPTSKTGLLGVPTDEQRLIDIADDNTTVERGDVLTCLTTRRALQQLHRHTTV